MRNLTDSQLMAKYQTANDGTKREIEGEVYDRHFGLVKTIANAFRIDGIDAEDRAAECLPAFLKAIRAYDPDNTTTLKTFVKLAVKRKLVDLFRQQSQCSEVPARALRSLHEVANEGDELALEDILASDEDIHANLETAEEVEATISRIGEDSFAGLIEAINKANVNANERLISSFVVFAEHRMKIGQISSTDFADIKELVADWSNQSPLFSMAPSAKSDQANDLIRSVFEKYVAIQTVILYDFAKGFLITEIADKYDVPATLVSEILAAIREVRDDEVEAVTMTPNTEPKRVATATKPPTEQLPYDEEGSLFAAA